MISGEFNSKGELIFEIGLIGTDEDVILVNAVLDTGFTGWLAIDNQDIESLGWILEPTKRDMQTARGESEFSLYKMHTRKPRDFSPGMKGQMDLSPH